MRSRRIALLLALAAAAPEVPGVQDGAARDPVRELALARERYGRARKPLSAQQRLDLERQVADARMLAFSDPARRRQVAVALLDLAAARPAGPAYAAELPVARKGEAAEVRALALDSLAKILRTDADGELGAWVASDVLARAGSQPLERRIAAAEGLVGLHLPATRLALFACAVAPERVLREAAMLALEGWDEDGVHRFLLEQLGRQDATPGWISPRVVRRHFTAVNLAPDSRAAAALAGHLQSALEGHDWRATYRALQLAPALPDALIVPALIDGLEEWAARRAADAGRLRIEGDLLHELRRRSSRNIGLFPERWRSWWKARQAAGVDASPDTDSGGATHAEFFGLRPLTDRVVFVLDRSGSMDFNYSGGSRTRYEEAMAQLMSLLHGLGETTRFRLILFSGDTYVWSDRLKPATPANLSSARAWMASRKPVGATHLRPGIREAMRLDRRGRLDLQRLEADTVVVVCDGETEEGPEWVLPMLEGPNEQACLVFHSVQIGAGGDGTLEGLAEGSGGEFVRVAP